MSRSRAICRLAPLALLLAPPALGGTVKGRVLLDERPVALATVSAVPYETPLEAARREARRGEEPPPIASVKSGADGTFLLTVPETAGRPPVPFTVRVEAPGAAPVAIPGAFNSSEQEDAGDVVVRKAVSLAGKVVDPAGSPVAGAEVTLLAGPGSEASPVPVRAKTAADGSFRFDAAGPDGNVVSVEAKGFAARRLAGTVRGGTVRPIALAPARTVRGTLRRSDRKGPAPSALVRLERGDGVTRWVETDPEGRFSVADASAEPWLLSADSGEAGFASVRDVRPVAPDGRPLVVDLVPPAVLEGRAIDVRAGKAVSRVKVALRAGSALRLARSGPDGRFRIGPLPADAYLVEADDVRYVPYRKRDLLLLRGEIRRLDVLLTPGATLSGKVVDEDGRPVAWARGRLARAGENPLQAMLRGAGPGGEKPAFHSRADGSFSASRLAPGDGVKLTVTHPEHEKAVVGGLSLPAGGVKAGVVVTLPRGLVVTGVVRDGDGQPIAGAEVSLMASATVRVSRGGAAIQLNLPGRAEERPRAVTGSDGRFLLRGVAAGDYSLQARKAGFATEVVDPVKLADGAAPEPYTLTLSPGAAIAGAVRRKDGSGVEGATVSLRPSGRPGGSAGPLGPGENPPTGPDGSFVFQGLKAGESYDLSVFSATGPATPRKVVAPAEGVELLAPGTGRIAGRVLDARSGQPIPEFTVSCEPARGPRPVVVRAVRAGSRRGGGPFGSAALVESPDGAFTLEEVPAGTWDVVVEARGYQSARAGNVVVEEGTTRDGVEVRAALGTTVKGRVTDGRSGRPVPEASVSLAEAGSAGGGLPIALLTFDDGGGVPTDADGRFELEGKAPGKYTLEVKHADYATATEALEVKEAVATTADVALAQGGSLGGVVVSETRQPLAGVEVSLATAGEGGPLGGLLKAAGNASTTDGGGRFRFEHLGPGRYTVTATLRGRSTSPVTAVLQSGETRDDLALSLAAGATLRGLVSGLPEGQRAGVSIFASGPDGFSASTRTGADGRFEVTGVPSGTVSVRASAGEMLGASRGTVRSVAVPDGQPVVDVELVFEGTSVLAGRVTRGGQPVGNVFLQIIPRGAAAGGSGRTGDDGTYRVEGLEAGSYQVVFQGLDFASGGAPQAREVKVEGETTLDVELPLARLAGTVVEAGTRLPLADVAVTATPAAAGAPGLRRPGGASTDSSGLFALEQIDPGSYTVTFQKARYQLATRTARAAESGGDELAVELSRGEGLGLRVRDGLFNVPLRGVTARVRDGAGANVLTTTVGLDGEGRGEIASLPPGTYSIAFETNGYAPRAYAGVSVPANLLEVALTPGGSVELVIGPKTLASGKPLQVADASGAPALLGLFGPDGRVVVRPGAIGLDHLAPGGYTVTGDAGTKTFTVAEGGRTVVELP